MNRNFVSLVASYKNLGYGIIDRRVIIIIGIDEICFFVYESQKINML